MQRNIRIHPLLFVLFLLLFPSVTLAESADAEKTAAIHRLLEVTGAIAMGSQMVDQLLSIQAQAQPNVPEEVWADIRKEIDFSEFEPAMVHIYNKHFSAAEIEGLLAFYESDIGRRFIEKQPAIVQDSMAAGQAWAIGIQEKLRTRLEERGFKPTGL